jgi:hypothetical protein
MYCFSSPSLFGEIFFLSYFWFLKKHIIRISMTLGHKDVWGSKCILLMLSFKSYNNFLLSWWEFFFGWWCQVGELKGTIMFQHDLFINDVLYVEVSFNLAHQKVHIFPSSLSSNISSHFMALLYVHVLIFLTSCVLLNLRGLCLGP